MHRLRSDLDDRADDPCDESSEFPDVGWGGGPSNPEESSEFPDAGSGGAPPGPPPPPGRG